VFEGAILHLRAVNAEEAHTSMSETKKNPRTIEGYYNYYGIPAYILRQKNGSFASGYYDWVEGVFKAGGSVKKILWDGMKVSFAEAKRLISRYSREHASEMDASGLTPDWILLPEEAINFLQQSREIRTERAEVQKKQQKKRRFSF
jgi:hypothetical protein